MTTQMKLFLSLTGTLLFLCISVAGCSAANVATTTNVATPTNAYPTYLPYNPQPRVGYVTTIRNAEIFQTLEDHFALANWTLFYGSLTRKLIVAIRCNEADSPMYDGRVLSGEYVMVDTYTYTTYPDELGRTFSKTVPIVIPREDYLKGLKK